MAHGFLYMRGCQCWWTLQETLFGGKVGCCPLAVFECSCWDSAEMASGSEDLAASAGGVTVRERPCWLCVYNTDEVVQKVCALIAEHGWTGTEWHCCKDLLCYLLEFTRTSDFWADSLSIAQCRKHDKMGYQNLQSDLQAALPQRQGRSTSYLRTGRLWPVC